MKRRVFLAVGMTVLSLFLTFQTLSVLARSVVGEAETRPISPTDLPILADFEGGLPAGFFQYNGGASSVTIATTEVLSNSPLALPGQIMTNTILSASFTIGDFGGFGADFAPDPQDWSSYGGLSFWFYGSNSGLTYQAEIFDNRSDPNSDTAERFDYNFVDDFTSWRHISIPFPAFQRATDYQPPGAPNDGLTLTEMWGWAFPLPFGSGSLHLDYLKLVTYNQLTDFESGFPAGFFQYNGGASSVTLATTEVLTNSPLALPGQTTTNTVLSASFTIGDYGGFGADFAPNPQNWSSYDGFSFWFYGSDSGLSYQAEIFDNRSDPNSDTAERFDYNFVDDFIGWRLVSIPFPAFQRATDYQPPGAPDDGLTLTEMWGFAFPLPFGTGSFYLDQVNVFGGAAVQELTVQLDSTGYTVMEGQTVTLTASLNMTATYPVTVTVATVGGTATAGNDYSAVSSTLTFPPNTTSQSFIVQTLEDGTAESGETIVVALSDPLSVTLGFRDEATITIIDNDAPPSVVDKAVIIDDFEDGQLPSGLDPNGIGIGFVTWHDPGSSVAITTTQVVSGGTPAPLPGLSLTNTVLQRDSNIVSWGGFSHAFENDDVTQWVSQDWSGYEGMSFWVHGTGNGALLFIDFFDNRNPGSTSDDAERWTYEFTDDFVGWKYFAVPFAEFNRKEIGNGAPNDGLTLTEVWGWAFGSLTSSGPQTHYIDNIGLLERVTVIDDFEDGQLPAGQDPNGVGIGFVTWHDPGSSVAITTTQVVSGGTPPAIPGLPITNTVLQRDSTIVSWGGFSHAFENEDVTQWVSQDWSTYKGVCFWVYGTGNGATLFVDFFDNRNPGSTGDDAERWTYEFTDDFVGWRLFAVPFTEFQRKEIGNGAPNDGLTLTEVWGWAFGSLTSNGPQTHYIDQFAIYGNTGGSEQALQVELANTAYTVTEGGTAVLTATLNMTSTETVTVTYQTAESLATPDRDYASGVGTLVFAPGTLAQTFTIPTMDDNKHEGNEGVMIVLSDPQNAVLGFPLRATLIIEDDDPEDTALLDDFEGYHLFNITGSVTLSATEIMAGSTLELPDQGLYENVLMVSYDTTRGSEEAGFSRTFAESQDWSSYEGMSFWYYGNNSGDTVAVELLDNQTTTTADVTPDQWELVWSDEFNETAGTPPNPNAWTHAIGDGTLNGIPGWGNGELEYYTSSPENAAMDGDGNLMITATEFNTATSNLQCWYGSCEYTSARLLSANKIEVEYGRIEARLQVPFGQGLWPAFWTLGNDIGEVTWPQSGEIDIMENIGREPATVHGTIHGPGYSGCCGIGGQYDLPSGTLSDDFHVFAIEWQPEQIRWFIDDTNYFTATINDIPQGSEWVFDHPFFILLNVAVGGVWPGNPDDSTTFPQTMYVDYVRVYQAANSSERFETSFTDNFTGWRKVTLPFSDFTRSTNQPPGAPNDGLTLGEVWGYSLKLLAGTNDTFYLDQVHLEAELPNFTIYLPVVGRP